jgi:hypothetical protein
VLSFAFYISISSPGRLDICPVVPSYICLLPSRSALTRIITGFRLNSHRERERQTYQGNVIDYRVLQIATERCSTIQPADESVFVIIKSHLHFISLHPQRHHPPPHPVVALTTFTARCTLSTDIRLCRSYTAPIVDFPLARVPSNDNGWAPNEFLKLGLPSPNQYSQQQLQRDGEPEAAACMSASTMASRTMTGYFHFITRRDIIHPQASAVHKSLIRFNYSSSGWHPWHVISRTSSVYDIYSTLR